ncbi:ABC transporter substrate-binding protein [Histidinibacterium aquaticum]|uniref:Peptide ABC transporter substrate-binding protein n=1 Tax=Histidinibacterium aquaticum TaxID=2613962 RepID=A0A5J5GFX5_9RHOB|nr:ABC transporter substrate-binding protein [Histidinibacterium aquaticum]KAA9006910.1 peptide ABC transporter substrate-binding protein [Histidinibacterium aquaticum]
MSGRADRRALLASGLAAAVFAASGMPVRAGAGRGGVLRAAVPLAGLSDARDGLIYETLTELAPDGTLRGALATDWEPVDGARAWALTLRPDVRFHDGPAFGADDVVRTLEGAVVEGPLRVRVTLPDADPDFPLKLAVPALAIRRGELGTGAYATVAEGGARFTARRLESHWRDGTAGWFDRVELIGLDPGEARLSALRTGRVDAASGLGLHAEGRLRAGGDHEVVPGAADLEAVSHRIGRGGVPMSHPRFALHWWAA